MKTQFYLTTLIPLLFFLNLSAMDTSPYGSFAPPPPRTKHHMRPHQGVIIIIDQIGTESASNTKTTCLTDLIEGIETKIYPIFVSYTILENLLIRMARCNNPGNTTDDLVKHIDLTDFLLFHIKNTTFFLLIHKRETSIMHNHLKIRNYQKISIDQANKYKVPQTFILEKFPLDSATKKRTTFPPVQYSDFESFF